MLMNKTKNDSATPTLEVDEDVDAVRRVVLAVVQNAQKVSHRSDRAKDSSPHRLCIHTT